MGLIISRFRKKPSTKDQLESIEKEIKYIHEFRVHTQQRQRRFVGSLIAYSVVLYICAFAIFYFYYFPDQVIQQILYSLPLLLFPLLVWVLKELLHWFFQNKLLKNETKLTELLRKKRKILDEVMETETYKVARELLEKFDPEQLRKKPISGKEDVLAQIAEPDMRRRNVGMLPGKTSPPWKAAPPATPHGTQSTTAGAFFHGGTSSVPFSESPHQSVQKLRPPGPPMPRPVLPRDRTFIDRLIEYLIGDGPTSRYALICRQCQSHNGMALKEEFEYMAFRCCYCYYWNPARRQRPAAPRLPEVQYSSVSSVDSENKPEKEEKEKGDYNHTSDEDETGSEFSIPSSKEEDDKEREDSQAIEEPVSTDNVETTENEKLPSVAESKEFVESTPTSQEVDSA